MQTGSASWQALASNGESESIDIKETLWIFRNGVVDINSY
jgi:hypothetical protein